jgi:predicted HicB family RNase H-like nuclease
MPEATNLNVRNFSPDLLRKIKATAALQGKTLREWVIEAVQEKLRRAK